MYKLKTRGAKSFQIKTWYRKVNFIVMLKIAELTDRGNIYLPFMN